MKIFNAETREKELFVPIDKNEVRIYACGPTVYNYFHLGNARPFIIFDTLRRYLEFRGYNVKFVQNFTDIDDKMINKANEEGITVAELAKRFIAEYFTDASALGVKAATVHPRATENIDAIIEIIKTLIEKGFAYEASGDVYYRAQKFEGYGRLSHMPIEDLAAGARISVNDIKESPLDFALWKAAKEGEPFWDSPWGKGRPGWHIECSAMANKYLGKTIDIHCGGQDLAFPHHENEIAQSEAANGVKFANYWMHNAYINIDNQKMSKSAGNFFTVRDISKQFDYEVIRFFMLSCHYRSPINFSAEILKQAEAGLARLYNCYNNLKFLSETAEVGFLEGEKEILDTFGEFREKFIDAMDDDLNTADAISVIFDFARELNTVFCAESVHSSDMISEATDMYLELCDVLGIVVKRSEDSLDSEIEELIKQRTQARENKDYATSDMIRDKLKAMNIELLDTPSGVKWIRK